MSYCRFGPESDVYMYQAVSGYFVCCGCALSESRMHLKSRKAALAHLHEHEAAAHKVPPSAIERLQKEMAGRK